MASLTAYTNNNIHVIDSDSPRSGFSNGSPRTQSIASTDLGPSPDLRKQDSIASRRDRKLSQFIFEEIVGKRLKCYEKWKLWLTLFIFMTVLAIVAIVLATVFATLYTNTFNTKTEAAAAQQNLIIGLINDRSANFSDHIDEAHKIFNTFDDDGDGLWDIDEFANHFVLTTGTERTFNSMDTDEDDILSFHEIVASLIRYELSHTYIPLVESMYNYSYTPSSNESYDPTEDILLNQYAANVYLDMYGINEFGYITRPYYYRHHSITHFNEFDFNNDSFIDFDEFSYSTAGGTKITYLRNYDTEYVINTRVYKMNHNFTVETDPTLSAGETLYSMCPSSYAAQDTGSGTRRRLVAEGFVEYVQTFGTCENRLTCDAALCDQSTLDALAACVTTVIQQYNDDTITTIEECKAAVDLCISTSYSEPCFLGCLCACNGNCDASSGYHYGCNYFCPEIRAGGFGRRRLADTNCDCGCGGCADQLCFGANSAMLIKRDGIVQNVPLKDMMIGDYAQTATGDWSKVWYIKQKEGDFAFLNVYFDHDSYITITGDHLVYIDDEDEMKRADEIDIGDTIFVMDKSSFLMKKEVIDIQKVVSSDGAYSPVTMDGSIVVSGVVSSCYAQSPEMAHKLHDTAAVFRWISTYNTNIASIVTDFFYEIMFMKLRQGYGLEITLVVFNVYSMPCIVFASGIALFFGLFRFFAYVRK